VSILGSIFKQTTFQIIGKVVTSISTFIVLGFVARNYHEAGTGIFTLSLTYLNIFNLLGDFGFNAHILKQVTEDKALVTSEWNKLLGARILWSVVLTILAVALLPFWPFSSIDFTNAIILGSVAILGSSIYITCNLIFQSKLRYDLSVFASSAGTLIGLFFYVWFSTRNFPIYFLLVAQSIGWISIAFLSLLFVKKFLSNILPIFDLKYISTLFKDSWAIAATLALNVVYFRVDSFLLAYFKGISEVGIYNVAYSVFQSSLVLPAFIMNAYYPLMLKSLAKVKLVGISLLVLASVGTVVTFFAAPLLIDILTGGNFGGSVSTLRILSLSLPAFFISALLMWYLVTKGKYKQMLIIYLFGLLVNIALNLFLIPKYSFFGAAWVTVFSEYFILILQIMILLFERSENYKETSR